MLGWSERCLGGWRAFGGLLEGLLVSLVAGGRPLGTWEALCRAWVCRPSCRPPHVWVATQIRVACRSAWERTRLVLSVRAVLCELHLQFLWDLKSVCWLASCLAHRWGMLVTSKRRILVQRSDQER